MGDLLLRLPLSLRSSLVSSSLVLSSQLLRSPLLLPLLLLLRVFARHSERSNSRTLRVAQPKDPDTLSLTHTLKPFPPTAPPAARRPPIIPSSPKTPQLIQSKRHKHRALIPHRSLYLKREKKAPAKNRGIFIYDHRQTKVQTYNLCFEDFRT